MHQRNAEYIDARPFTASSTKSSCYARPDHTCGSLAATAVAISGVRFTPESCRDRYRPPAFARCSLLRRRACVPIPGAPSHALARVRV